MKAKTASSLVAIAVLSVTLLGCARQSSTDSRVMHTEGTVDKDMVTAVSTGGAADVVTEPAASDAAVTDPEPDPKNAGIIIGHFRGRQHTITIYSSQEGPRFSVKTDDGRVLAEALSAREIQAKLPEVYNTYRSTFAQNESDGFMDARGPTPTRSQGTGTPRGRSFLDASSGNDH